jgi:acetyltransferase EpsM
LVEPLRPLLLLGAGRFAAEVADLAEEVGGWRVEAFVQNLDPQQTATHEGRPVRWIDDAFREYPGAWAVCALGGDQRARFVAQAAAAGARFATLVHPSAHVSPRAALEDGVVVSPGAVVSAHARLGRHVVVGRGALVGHHVTIGDLAFLAPGANLCGSCAIGEGAFLGAGSVIRDHCQIGAGAFVGIGSVVVSDVAAGERVLGVPARPWRLGAGGETP